MREAVSLNYSSIELYNIICKYESVYDTLLNDDGIRTYGIGLVLKKINTLLSTKDVGMMNLLGEFADDSDVREVSIFFLHYYTNLRGKDYVRKFNARSNISTETLRATVGVTYDLARKRNENDRKQLTQNIAAPPNESMDNAEDDDGEDLENVYDFETMMKKQLKALCKQYKLRVSGTKDELLNRLREFTASHQNKSELESER